VTTLRERYDGVLLGLAAGDALGGSVEFMPRSAVLRAHPNGVREITGGGPHDLRRGEVTDDTAMALAIARACTAEGIDLDQVAANFLEWYRSDPKDIGITTSRALAKMDAGVSWHEIGDRMMAETPQKLAGNGSVMRCAPIALRFRSDRERLRRASIDTSRMTHPDPMATWGSVALNQAIAWLLNGGSLDGAIAAAIEGVENEDVVKVITGSVDRPYDAVTSSGFVLDTLGASFWALAHRDSAEEAIVTAVSMGDDTDTTGAVTGALAGAYYGAAALPERWLSVLEPRDELVDLAGRLLAWSEADDRAGRS